MPPELKLLPLDLIDGVILGAERVGLVVEDG